MNTLFVFIVALLIAKLSTVAQILGMEILPKNREPMSSAKPVPRNIWVTMKKFPENLPSHLQNLINKNSNQWSHHLVDK